MTLLVILDVAVAGLLCATIWFCVVLNRRLAALRRNEAELRDVLTKFNEAAHQTESGIVRLKEAGREVAAALSDSIGEARALRDDLAFVTDRGGRMVAELTDRISSGRRAPESAPISVAPSPQPRSLSKAERDLLAALEHAR